MTSNSQENELVELLVDSFRCHAIILYGSRACGTAREDSDWNIVAFHHAPYPTWVHEEVEGIGTIHATIYPESLIQFHGENVVFSALEIRHGRVLLEHEGLGANVIAQAQRIYEEGPGDPPSGFAETIRHFYFDHVIPIHQREDILPAFKHFRRQQALVKSLHNYFLLRRMWRPSPAEAFRYLQTQDPAAYAAFANAMRPSASVDDLAALFTLILDC